MTESTPSPDLHERLAAAGKRLRARPDDDEARLLQVDALARLGRFTDARKALAPALARSPRDARLLEAEGLLLAQTGRLKEAEAACARACAADGAGLDPYFGLALALQRRGRTPRMLAVLRRALLAARPPGPGDLRAELTQFRLAVLACDYERAVGHGERVLSSTRDLESLEVLRWPVFVDEFDLTYGDEAFRRAALAALGRFIRRRPRAPWGYYYRSILLQRRADECRGGAKASSRLRALWLRDLARLERRVRPRHRWMLMERAKERLRSGRLKAAIRSFRAVAAATEPQSWYAHCQIAEIHACLGDDASARESFARARAVARERDLGNVLGWEGEARLWAGDYAAALELERAALARGAQYAHGWMGAALLKLGRPREALPALDRAVEVSPWDVESKIWRAETLLELGRLDEALRQIDEAVKAEDGLHARLLRACIQLARSRERAAAADYARLPAAVRRAAQRHAGAELRRRLEWIRTASRGVRRDGWERGAWTSRTPGF